MGNRTSSLPRDTAKIHTERKHYDKMLKYLQDEGYEYIGLELYGALSDLIVKKREFCSDDIPWLFSTAVGVLIYFIVMTAVSFLYQLIQCILALFG
jgi:hypothetical protein